MSDIVTLLAFAEHGQVCELLAPDHDGAQPTLDAVAAAGVDLDDLGARLQAGGARSFSESWAALLGCVASKVEALSASVS